MRDESEKEVVHRLEAFSDIVIGFSLAQLGLSLTIPSHAIDLFVHVKGARSLLALAITFLLICAVWWSHHRLFRHAFVPTPVNIFANFAALGGVIFLAYSMQVLMHVGIFDRIAYAMYTGSYAWILSLFAFLWWNGIRLRGDQLRGPLRTATVRHAVRATIIALWLVIMTILALRVGTQTTVNELMLIVLVLAFATQRVVMRRFTNSAHS
ncbi:MAG: DUF1211 domain-containing protein [Candidatus Eremiobacteraeota bacterium]|nr:DUF1211 domain-containing protein [Candidatus Eremiobacteraeota bacterium]